MLAHWIWFAALRGVSLRQKLQLLEHFSDPEELYYADLPEDLSPEIIEALSQKDLTDARKLEKKCADLRIQLLTYGDAAYPNRLRSIRNPPLVLYYKGVLPDFEMQPVIGVVGTRKATSYGKTTALDMSRQIAACGALVVSGGAAGVDTQALKGALGASAPAVAVLGCGVDVVFPASNRELFQKIQEKGCLISEYPPGTKPKPWQFPERNRIISGLSHGVLVIEAPEKSGALITARDALEQGRDVFAVPGSIHMSTCAGSNTLLQEGASAVLSGWDVLKDYAPQYPGISRREFIPKMPDTQTMAWVAEEATPPLRDKKSVDKPKGNAYSDQDSAPSGLDPLSRKLLSCLDAEPTAVDDVIARVQEPAAEVLGALTKLALLGMVVNHPGRLVSAKRK